MPGLEPLQPGHHYHIYNRGNDSETLFPQDRNYWYFLTRTSRNQKGCCSLC
jgi:hypothetical protein